MTNVPQPIWRGTSRGGKARYQKIASFLALHRDSRGEAKRTFHQKGGFLRSRIIPASAASGGGREGNHPQAPPPPSHPPSPLTHSPPPPYHPPYTPPVRPDMNPIRGGKGGEQPRGRGNAWASREPAVEGKNLRTVEGSYPLSLSLLS